MTDGIDRLYGTGDLQDPYLDEAIDNALRTGIAVSAIYTPGAGHFGHSYWRTCWGQIYLAQLADSKPPKKANRQRIRRMTEVPNADLVGPAKV